MPSYTYRCCDHGLFEVTKPMSESSNDERCPECGGPTNRFYVAPPVLYKADGFHTTDYFNDTVTGTKAERLREKYRRVEGEEPPPPAPDVR